MHASEVWESEALNARVARAALTPLSWLYAAGWQAYLGVYGLGLKRAGEPHRPVICVGNLVVGGSGKSPFTRFIASELRAMGRQVVVSCSGYGSGAAEAASMAPNGPLSPRDWGDEPAMLRWLDPDLPLIVGRRRVLAAELCHRHFPNAVMLMDDGFQHLPLKKHLSIVLDNPNPSNRRCLPAGPYREPRGNRKRADLVLPGEFSLESAIVGFCDAEGQRVDPHAMNGCEATYLCALGQPQKFIDALTGSGILAERGLSLPDHDPLTAGNLLDALPADLPVIVTAKDWVKLRERPDVGKRRFLVALHEVRAQPADGFRAWLEAKLNGIEKASPQ
jgi:tetraacyldisaccharide 4'-kinase